MKGRTIGGLYYEDCPCGGAIGRGSTWRPDRAVPTVLRLVWCAACGEHAPGEAPAAEPQPREQSNAPRDDRTRQLTFLSRRSS